MAQQVSSDSRPWASALTEVLEPDNDECPICMLDSSIRAKVMTPCGHIFGRDCLIESLQKVGTPCPRCRQELRPRPAMPAVSATPPAPTVQNGAPSAIVGLADLDEAISALVSTFVASPEVPEEPTKPNV